MCCVSGDMAPCEEDRAASGTVSDLEEEAGFRLSGSACEICRNSGHVLDFTISCFTFTCKYLKYLHFMIVKNTLLLAC